MTDATQSQKEPLAQRAADASSVANRASLTPQPFGKYWLDAQLAEGGMSRVLLARLRGPGGFEKKLVVKQILPRLAQDPGFVELFVREANTLVQMSHPNIVPVYELGVVDGVYFLAMELVDGATVTELLRDGPLPEALCAHIGAQVCEALRYAHERFGVVHRDVTPRNVIVDAGGHVRLLDFGIAAPFALAADGELFGSPGYMSPEQLRGQALGGESDLFSLGTVLYEALTARHALPQQARPASTAELPTLLAAADAIDGELAALVNQLLALEPSARPASAGEAATSFRTWLAQKHPAGVAAALGRRVELARARAAPEPDARYDTGAKVRAPSESKTAGVTRSIATSRQLAELLAHGTEALPRRSPAPTPPEAPPEIQPAAARGGVHWWLAALVVCTTAALVWLREPTPAAVRARSQANATSRASVSGASHATTITAQVAPRAPVAPALPASTGTSEAANAAPPAPTLAPRARISVNALPWAELKLDGHALGSTPKRGLSMSPGSHVLELDCPPLGRSARVPLKLAAGEQKQIVVDLNRDPPGVTLK